jgi:hypothetical protein
MNKTEKAYLFEKTHTLDQIKEVALRMLCGKIDKELVKKFQVKEELIAYLRSRNCPALVHLESSCTGI